MTKQEKLLEIRLDVKFMRNQIKTEADAIRTAALEIQEELTKIAAFAGQIVADPKIAKHFRATPWDMTAWRNMQTQSIRLDARIKATMEMERLLELIDEDK